MQFLLKLFSEFLELFYFIFRIIFLVKSTMNRFLNFGALGGGLGAGPVVPSDSNQVDTSETVRISSLALLKMLKHGRAGVPMEVNGYFLIGWINCNRARTFDFIFILLHR